MIYRVWHTYYWVDRDALIGSYTLKASFKVLYIEADDDDVDDDDKMLYHVHLQSSPLQLIIIIFILTLLSKIYI